MKKRIISILVAVAVVVMMIPTAGAEQEIIYVQNTLNAQSSLENVKYKPAIILYPDSGEFLFIVNLYSAISQVRGSYERHEGSYWFLCKNMILVVGKVTM
jgi:ABC-type cobalt transport system substrate-binding protein